MESWLYTVTGRNHRPRITKLNHLKALITQKTEALKGESLASVPYNESKSA